MKKLRIFAIDAHSLKLVSGHQLKCVGEKAYLGDGLIWREILCRTVDFDFVDDNEKNNEN